MEHLPSWTARVAYPPRGGAGLSLSGMPPDHGVTRYDDYACRCLVCREANADRHRIGRRAADRQEDNPALEYGTKATYVNHGCRCESCAEAQRVANRRRYGG